MLGVPLKHLIYYLYRFDKPRYHEFAIRKRRGGVRNILAPHPSIKILQQSLHGILQTVYTPPPSVKGFVIGESIAKNAQLHEGMAFVGNVDLDDFFGTINFGRVRGLFLAPPFLLGTEVATAIANLCCHNNALPQGAPTSPIIANMICRRLDNQLYRLARRRGCIYSRYADDITFSSATVPFPNQVIQQDASTSTGYGVGEELLKIIENNGFTINESKVRLSNERQRQTVTGLVVNKRTNVRRRYIRQVRAMLHAWRKFGLDNASSAHIARYDSKHRPPFRTPPDFRAIVKGKINFIGMVRGHDDAVYLGLLEQYADLDPTYTMRPPDMRRPNHLTRIEDGIWVIECQEWQGTAFLLKGYGLITCNHVVGTEPFIYQPSNPLLRHPVTVVARDADIDIAILAPPPNVGFEFTASWVDDPPYRMPVMIAGYPRYDTGMTLWRSHGTVAGRRLRFGCPRIVINGLIIAGASGSPVLDAKNRVIGVAATGADYLNKSVENEFHGFIPITSLRDVATPTSGDP